MRRRLPLAAGLAAAAVAVPVALAVAGGDDPPATDAAEAAEASAAEGAPTPAEGAGRPAQPRLGALPPHDAAAVAAARAARLAEADVVDLPVRFTVRNVNTSLAACAVDGRTYTVRGHLTAPRAVLDSPDRGITLYQHGIAAGEWYWRVGVEGYDHAEEMARRGHASLTVDRLGYGDSDLPHGADTCIGGQADIAHQVVQALRSGGYEVLPADGGGEDGSGEGAWAAGPSFSRVVLAGQSNGGQVAQIATYSFRDVDGLVLLDWADLGLTPQANARFFASLQACLRGGSPAEAEDDPTGYAYYDAGPQEYAGGNFADTEPAVLAAALTEQNRHPCGDMVSQLGAVLVDLRHVGEIDVPVLFLYGEQDARVQGGPEHARLFTGTDDTTLVTLPRAGHYAALEREARTGHDALASWLDERGL